MRYAEAQVQPSKEKEEVKEPRVLPQAGKYSYEDLSGGKKPPKLGGNSFGSS